MRRKWKRWGSRKPKLSVPQILAWADAYQKKTGRWPHASLGVIPNSLGETWASVSGALRNGCRGLPGGSSLARLLAERRGHRNLGNLPPLTVKQILAWADLVHRKTGRWPHAHLGRIDASGGENWGSIDLALSLGQRGLPGGTTLARLLAEHRDYRNLGSLPRLTETRILAWADAYRRRNRRWPTLSSGPIAEAPGETWHSVNQALYLGCRGFPGGSSLPKLLAQKRGKRHLFLLPPLSEERILALSDEYFRKHGRWPKRNSGPVDDAGGGTWLGINTCLDKGGRGLPGGTSLAQLLAAKRGVRNKLALGPLRQSKILAWARAHFRHTGSWPKATSGPIHDAPGETWAGINWALSAGYRGLPGGVSLAGLLQERGYQRNPNRPPPLTVDPILLWADRHHKRTGRWPTQASGAVRDAKGETWSALNSALKVGCRGLPGGSSLACLLAEHRGKPIRPTRRLSKKLILAWAKAHYQRTGSWPTTTSGPILDAPGETWRSVARALEQGRRGLPGGRSLARLLAGRKPPV